MNTYYKLRRLSDKEVIKRFKDGIPEFENMSHEKIRDYLSESNLEFFESVECKTSAWHRLMLPFALVLYLVMFLCLPITFMVTGVWGYKNLMILNWFKSLGL